MARTCPIARLRPKQDATDCAVFAQPKADFNQCRGMIPINNMAVEEHPGGSKKRIGKWPISLDIRCFDPRGKYDSENSDRR